MYGLKRLPASACGAIVSLEPVYAIMFAAVLFAEPVWAAVLASAVLIVGSSWLLLRQPADMPSLRGYARD